MAAVSISEMNGASEVARTDLFEMAAVNAQSSSGYSSYKQALGDIADAINGDFTFSDLDTTDKTIVGAINEIAAGGGGGGSSYVDFSAVLPAGSTQVTITDADITVDGDYEVLTDVFGIDPVDVYIQEGSAIITFDSYGTDLNIKLRKSIESTPSTQSWDYSTDETNTNQKWTDGNEIYCKVFHFDSPVAINGNSNVGEFPTVSIDNLDTLVDVHAIGTMGSQGYKFTFSGSAWYDAPGFGLKIAGFTVSGAITDVIVYYTKTTT